MKILAIAYILDGAERILFINLNVEELVDEFTNNSYSYQYSIDFEQNNTNINTNFFEIFG